MPHLIALDQGTTSSRAILFDEGGRPRRVAQREFGQIFPQPGWVEHDPREIWTSQSRVAAEVLEGSGISTTDVVGLGITNQRETTVIWERATGEPIHNAIVWQDRRTASTCERLVAAGHGDDIQARTGLVLDAYFSGTKVAWILDHVDGARARAAGGELAFGTIDSWLVYRLTGGRLHITDPSNASRTLLFNIHGLEWDDALLELFDVPREVLPEVRPSSEVHGEVSALGELAGVPIAGILGDQQAALAGQRCFQRGQSKNTYGTGCFSLMNTGTEARPSENRLLTTIAWSLRGETQYALEGGVFIGGAVVQWLRDGLGLITKAEDIERLAATVPDTGDVYLVPAFAGLGAPHWDPHARGTLTGITRGTNAAHIARAALESIAFQVADLLDALEADAGTTIPELRADGGASTNETLMQFQADILGKPVIRPEMTEMTALGAAYMAGLAAGVWKDLDQLCSDIPAGRRFEPQMPADKAQALRARWSQAVGRSKGWAPAS